MHGATLPAGQRQWPIEKLARLLDAAIFSRSYVPKRPMSLHAIPLALEAAPAHAGLSPPEEQERLSLARARLRRSVDHFARAWYGSIASLILTGLALKLFHDHPGFRPIPALLGAAGLLGWCFAIGYFFRSRRVARAEQEMLTRLQALETRAPKPRELF